MSKKETSKYHQLLLTQRESVLAGLGAKARELSRTDRICEEDQAQYSLEEAVSLRLNGLEYSQLREIQESLDRLKLGEYGTCLACEGVIAPKRLAALPWARYCVGCQENRPLDADPD
jgi:DnaK suppressor protein